MIYIYIICIYTNQCFLYTFTLHIHCTQITYTFHLHYIHITHILHIYYMCIKYRLHTHYINIKCICIYFVYCRHYIDNFSIHIYYARIVCIYISSPYIYIHTHICKQTQSKPLTKTALRLGLAQLRGHMASAQVS